MFTRNLFATISAFAALVLLSGADQTLEERARNPTAEEVRRLCVEWGRPQVNRKHGTTVVTIDGRLLLRSADAKGGRPVDWVQPVGIVIAKTPGTHPDWSQGVSGPDTTDIFQAWVNWSPERTSTSTKDGRFSVDFVASQIHRPVGEDGVFAVGLMLSRVERTGSLLSATNDTPVLPQSIGQVTIARQATIDKTFSVIEETPSPAGGDYDPAALVRAVNHVRSLGKPAAIRAFREFLEIINDPGYPRAGPGFGDWNLALLVPFVFESADKTPAPPQIIYVSVVNGIPFHTEVINGIEGNPWRARPQVDWAEAHGRIIAGQLRPSDDPVGSAEKLLAQQAKTELGLVQHVRLQAWRMLRHLPGVRELGPPAPCESAAADAKWAELKAKVRKLKIRWDEAKQEYVAG